MSLISFWGTVHGQAGTTSNLVSVASMVSLEYNLRTMISQTQWSRSTLETSFLKREFKGGMLSFSDTGLDALERLAKSNRLSPEIIPDYTTSLLKERLDLLMGSEKPNKSMFENMNSVLSTILDASKQQYDLCMVDVHSGTQNNTTHQVLKESDLIVVNLNQNIHVLNRFFNKEDWLDVLDEKPYIIVLSQYDPQSHYNVKNIRRRFNCKKPIFTVPYNTDFRDACNDQNAIEFFLRARNFSKNHESSYYVEEVRKLTSEIVRLVNSEVQEKIKGA
jgi:hypothetical protein